jgi:hypothetical protein
MATAKTIKHENKTATLNLDEVVSYATSENAFNAPQNPSINATVTPDTELLDDVDIENDKKLIPAPTEIHDLMKVINEMLERGDDIPDTLISEFEAQMNVVSDFDVEELMNQFKHASIFNGISSVLEAKNNRQKNHQYNELSIKSSTVPSPANNVKDELDFYDIPLASIEELMSSMREPDLGEYHDAHQDYSAAVPEETVNIINHLNQKPVHEMAEEAVNSAKEAENINVEDNSKREASELFIDKKSDKAELDTSSSANQNNSAHPKNTVPTLNASTIFMPLMSSLSATFSKMMSIGNPKKPMLPHLDKDDYTQRVFGNKLTDFKNICEQQQISLMGILDLTKNSLNGVDNREIDLNVLKDSAADFNKHSLVMGKAYANLMKISSNDDDALEVKGVAKEFKDNFKKIKDEINEIVKDSKPSVFTKFIAEAWGAISKSVDFITGYSPLEGNGKTSPQPVQEL